MFSSGKQHNTTTHTTLSGSGISTRADAGDDSDDEDFVQEDKPDGMFSHAEFYASLKQMEEQFYAVNKKNRFFKKTQKAELTKFICSQLDINILLNNLIIVGETNNVYFDYQIFKLFANADNYDSIIQTCIQIFSDLIVKYGSYIIHVNLKSITVSAVERHKNFVSRFTQQCITDGRHLYSMRIENLFIYNSPPIFETIRGMMRPLIDPNVMAKLKIVST